MLKQDGSFAVPPPILKQSSLHRCLGAGALSGLCNAPVAFVGYTYASVGQQVGSSKYVGAYLYRCVFCKQAVSFVYEPTEADYEAGVHRAHRLLADGDKGMRAGPGKAPDAGLTAAVRKYRDAQTADAKPAPSTPEEVARGLAMIEEARAALARGELEPSVVRTPAHNPEADFIARRRKNMTPEAAAEIAESLKKLGPDPARVTEYVGLTGVAVDEHGVSKTPREMDYLPAFPARRRVEVLHPAGPQLVLSCEGEVARVEETPDGLRLVFASNPGLVAWSEIRDGAAVYLGGGHTADWRATVLPWCRRQWDEGRTITVRVYAGPPAEPRGRFVLSAVRTPGVFGPPTAEQREKIKALWAEAHKGITAAGGIVAVAQRLTGCPPTLPGHSAGAKVWAPLAGSTDVSDPDNWRAATCPLTELAKEIDADAAVEAAQARAVQNGVYPGPVRKQTPELGDIPDRVIMQAVCEGGEFPLLVGVPIPVGGATVTVREVFGGTITPEAARGLLDGTVKTSLPPEGEDDEPKPFLAGEGK